MSAPLLQPKKKEAQIFPNVSWEQFELIEQSFESIVGVKFAYLDGTLEIMTISPEYDQFDAVNEFMTAIQGQSQG